MLVFGSLAKIAQGAAVAALVAATPALAQTSSPSPAPPAPAAAPRAMTDADCEAAWKAADRNIDGYIATDEDARYIAASRAGGRDLKDDRLELNDFLADCKAGHFAGVSMSPPRR